MAAPNHEFPPSLASVLGFLEAEYVEPAAANTADLLRQLREVWPHPIPSDQLDYLTHCGFYNAGLWSEGKEVTYQHQLFDLATVLDRLEFMDAELEMHDLLPLAGLDNCLDCLTPDGRYVTADLAGGDILREWEACAVADLLAEQVVRLTRR